jgi:PilZ domain
MSGKAEVQFCRRREQREAVDVPAIAFRRDGSRSVVSLSDLSYDGCQLSGGPVLSAEERIRLIVPYRGNIGARIRWASPDRAGASFNGDVTEPETVPLPKSSALRFVCPYNFGSGRVFGRRGL